MIVRRADDERARFADPGGFERAFQPPISDHQRHVQPLQFGVFFGIGTAVDGDDIEAHRYQGAHDARPQVPDAQNNHVVVVSRGHSFLPGIPVFARFEEQVKKIGHAARRDIGPDDRHRVPEGH